MTKLSTNFALKLRACLTLVMLFVVTSLAAQEISVRGSVKDASGEPVIGATVKIAGAKTGVITNMDGEYLITCPSNTDLEFNYIGYKSQKVAVNGKKVIDVVLQEESTNLNEVVVTALGIKKDARKVGYAVSSVSADDIVKTSSPTLGTALYGKAAGVEVKTAPGGAAGAISINVRGISSITGNNQPLIILDGMPIRNGEANNSDYWTSQRVNSNGLADINPEDIENISILKGAAATAQYGSEGANGVVMITTKTGRRGAKGIGVEFNASFTGNYVAYMPKYQTTYGPGVAPQSRAGSGCTDDGWYTQTDRNGVSQKAVYTGARTYFGPAYDGSEVYYYDGTMRKYESINDNPWSEIFRTGFDQQYNVALTHASDKGNFRFSYTYLNSTPNQYNSTFDKHNFNLTGSYNILNNLKLDVSANYMPEHVKNRPYRIYRLVANFAGMFGPFDDISYIRHHTMTEAGYMNNVYTATNHENPAEGFAYDFGCRSGLVDEYFWNIYGKTQLESNNRFIGRVSPSWEIIPGLTLKGSIGTDYTTNKIENQNRTEHANAFGNLSGSYSLTQSQYTILYGDIMLMYEKQLTDKFDLSAYVGWSGRREKYFWQQSNTSGGLTVENWFNLAASKNSPTTSEDEIRLLKTAWYGDISLSWDNWAYLEATLRNEKSSTLFKDNNSFWYPSVSGSIIYSELLKDKRPSWLDYGKVRLSYGVVGLAPDAYYATQAFNQGTAHSYVYNEQPSSVGNNNLKPEKTYEWEIGWENKFLHDRVGFDFSYYHKDIKDQILSTTMPASSGAKSIAMNVGEFTSKGVELALYGTPLLTKDWRIDVRFNIAWNTNKVKKLAEGIDRLEHKRWDNGSVYLYSKVGGSIGDFYAYAPQTDENGNYIVDASTGWYKLTDEPVKVGNAMPKYTGGAGVTVSWKNLALDVTLSYRHGGSIFNMPYEYMMGRGAIEESMDYRDEAHGGQSYYIDNSVGNGIVPATTAPAGKTLYHDGMILPGVRSDNGQPNDIMISAMRWYNWSYNWGTDAPTYYSHSIFKNSYVKVREITLSYSFPKLITDKLHMTRLVVSAYARNPFYIYKNLPIFDAEATDATSWIEQSWIGGSTATTRSFGVSLKACF